MVGTPMSTRPGEGGTSSHHEPGGAGESFGTGSREGPAVQQPAPENQSGKKSSSPNRESEAKHQRTGDLALETDPSVDITELEQKSEEFLSWCSNYARHAKGRSSQLARDLHDEKIKNEDLQKQILEIQQWTSKKLAENVQLAENVEQLVKNLADTERENQHLRERIGHQQPNSVISIGTPKSKGVDHACISEGEMKVTRQFNLLCQTVSETKSAIQDVKGFLMEHLPQPRPQNSAIATLNSDIAFTDWAKTQSPSKFPHKSAHKSARKTVEHDDPSRHEDFDKDPTNEEATKDVPSGDYTPEPVFEPVFVDLELCQTPLIKNTISSKILRPVLWLGKDHVLHVNYMQVIPKFQTRPNPSCFACEDGSRKPNMMSPAKRRKSSRFDSTNEESRRSLP